MSDDQNSQDIDLFGAPVSQIKERWGRKSYAKTPENQQLVALLRSAGWTHSRIAMQMGCDEKTLRKHFSRELDSGSDLIEAQAMQVLYKQMRDGKGTAINKMLDIIDRGRAAPPLPKVKADDDKLGKKETLNRGAANPIGGWADTLQ